MMASISDDLRQQVIDRAVGRCEYCQAPLAIVVEMEVDHIIPQSAGGQTKIDNLCLACVGCNGFKLAFQEAEDPETGETTFLFNPRLHKWSEHFAWSEDGTTAIGLTPTGRATIARLRMNRERMVAARRLWSQAGWHPPG
ncbi:MAG: HNH endonuclease [Anaerolineae bacterium]|nr:HNH endonuclease [Anaerolineae bacterium]